MLNEVDEKMLQRCRMAKNYEVSEVIMPVIIKKEDEDCEDFIAKSERSAGVQRLRSSAF